MNVVYVDDELPALENFRMTASGFPEIENLKLFSDGEAAFNWLKEHVVDVVFLDMEMPGLHGVALAHEIREFDENIRIIFMTAHSQFAMDAWGVDATGYLLKPYSTEEFAKQLKKCNSLSLPSSRVTIQTIPELSVWAGGKPVHISGGKTRELFALLVDQGARGITAGEGIAYLWPDRINDSGTNSLFRMTYKRLSDSLKEAGIGSILVSEGKRRFLKTEQVDCDLYHILEGDADAARKYNGQYLKEYGWAEERNGQLYRMLLGK